MTGPIITKAFIRVSEEDLTSNPELHDRISDEIERRNPHYIGNISTAHGFRPGIAEISVEDMPESELTAILTSIGFRLVDKSTPAESADIAKMPKPELKDGEWNVTECLDWLELVIDFTPATNAARTQAYLSAMKELRDSFTTQGGDEEQRHEDLVNTGKFMTALAIAMSKRSDHGGIVDGWQKERGIKVGPKIE